MVTTHSFLIRIAAAFLGAAIGESYNHSYGMAMGAIIGAFVGGFFAFLLNYSGDKDAN